MKAIAFRGHRQHAPAPATTRGPPIVRLKQGALVLIVGFVIGGLLDQFALNVPVQGAQVGYAVPEFSAPPLTKNSRGLSSRDLKDQVSLVNVFASWCQDCRVEHPLIMRIAARGYVPVYGLDYKDDTDAAVRWLKTLGNPYVRAGADPSGDVAAVLGVRDPPETLLIDPMGRIVYRHRGPLTRQVFRDAILPLLQSLLEIDEGDY